MKAVIKVPEYTEDLLSELHGIIAAERERFFTLSEVGFCKGIARLMTGDAIPDSTEKLKAALQRGSVPMAVSDGRTVGFAAYHIASDKPLLGKIECHTAPSVDDGAQISCELVRYALDKLRAEGCKYAHIRSVMDGAPDSPSASLEKRDLI